MMTKTEQITEMSMKLSEAQNIAIELRNEYKARHEVKEAEFEAMEKREHTYEEFMQLLDEEQTLFMLYILCERIWICRRRSTKMMSDLWEQIIKAEELGLEVI